MSEQRAASALLSLEGARAPLDPRFGALATLDLQLKAGELVLIDPGGPAPGAALADAICGLELPTAGEIRFLGRCWRELKPDAANALRGRIGRVFARGGWLEHLTVLENVLLQQLHQTRRERALLLLEASRLAQRLELPGLPMGLPHEHGEAELRRAGCVRAFLGRPALVILEEPVGTADELLAPLLNLVLAALGRGAAVLWLTTLPRVLGAAAVPARDRYRLLGGRLVSLSEQAA